MLGRWIKQTSTSTGTGNLTLSAVSGFLSFADLFAVNQAFHYTVLDVDGKPIEEGIGHLSDSTTLVRDAILATLVSGTYDDTSPAAASLAVGTKTIIQSVTQAGVAHQLPRQPTMVAANDNVIMPLNWYTPEANVAVCDYPDFLFFFPALFSFAGLVDGFICRPNGSDTVDFAIYSMAASGLPAHRICGDTGVSLISGVNNITLTNQGVIKSPGWYFIALNVNSAVVGWYRARHAGGNMGINQSRGFPFLQAGYRVLQAQGTFPATLTGGTRDRWSSMGTDFVPIVYPRIAA